ncbi:MAG: amidohydrolase family protein [Firmicutes bacterium]|nr:amidohydrolase family protein [Bacillota bacterium]
MSVLIDFHAHIFPEKVAAKAVNNISTRYQQEAHHQGLYQEYLDLLARDGFDYGVVSTAATKPEQVRPANNWAIKLNQHPSLRALGTIHLDYPDWKDEIQRVYQAGIRGFKLHPDFQRFYPDDPRAMEMYAQLPEGFVLLIHAGDDSRYTNELFSHPRRIAKVVEAFPKLQIVVAHMGGYRLWDQAREWLVGKDVYLDTSSAAGFLDPAEFVAMVREHGHQRIIFGSDFPFRGPGEEKQILEKIGLNQTEVSAIMGENALRLSIFPRMC